MEVDPDELTAKERIVIAGMALSGMVKYPPDYIAMMVVRLVQEVPDDDPRFDTLYDSTAILDTYMARVMAAIAAAKEN